MLQDYIKLITPEHRFKPKYIEWISVALGMVNDLQNLFSQLNSAFDIDTAVGAQLDVLGRILNLSRNLPYQPQVSDGKNPVFSWGEDRTGLGGWGVGYWLMSGLSPVLNDDYYRILLKAAIIKNQWNGTANSLLNLINKLFGNSGLLFQVQDGQDMSFTVIAFGTADPLTMDMLKHAVMIPHPEGVKINIVVSDTKVFSWGESSAVYGGWNEGNWVSKEGTT
mgnify:CR=1 FL=1